MSRSAPDRAARWPAWAGVAAVWLVALVTRLPAMGHSLWWDEAYSAVFYAGRGPWAIFSTDAFVVNNHVLFNLLNWATTRILWDGEAVLRLWSLVPALGALALLQWWAWRRWGPWTSVVVGALVALSPLHQDLSVMARGYGLVFLAVAAMLVASVHLHEGGGRRWWGLLVAAGIVSTWTILPTIALFGMHAGVLFLRRGRRVGAVASVVAVVAADVAFYRALIPLILRYSQGAGLREGIGAPWHAPVTVPAERMLRPLVESASPDGYPVVMMVLAVALGIAAVAGLVWASERVLALHALGVVAGTLVAMWVIGANIVDRYVSFMLLHVLVAAGVGLVAAARRAVRPDGAQRPTGRAGRLVPAGVAAVLALAVGVSVGDGIGRASVPREDYRAGSAVIDRADVDTVLLNRMAGTVGFSYYLGRRVVERVAPEDVDEVTCAREQPYVLIDYPMPGTDDHGDLGCVRRDATEVVTVHQGNARAPTYRVFVVRPQQDGA